MTSVKQLKELGGFVSDKPVKKDITFSIDGGDELTATIHVKQLNIGEYETLFLTDTEERARTAKAISVAITLGEDGREKISFQDAYRLHPKLAGAMLVAFNEVNNPPKKTSRPASDSSAT